MLLVTTHENYKIIYNEQYQRRLTRIMHIVHAVDISLKRSCIKWRLIRAKNQPSAPSTPGPVLYSTPEKQSPVDAHSPIPNLLAIVVSLQLRRGENRGFVGMVVSRHLDRDAQWVVMMLGMDGNRSGASTDIGSDCAHQSLVVGVGVPRLDEDVHPVADLAWIVFRLWD